MASEASMGDEEHGGVVTVSGISLEDFSIINLYEAYP